MMTDTSGLSVSSEISSHLTTMTIMYFGLSSVNFYTRIETRKDKIYAISKISVGSHLDTLFWRLSGEVGRSSLTLCR
jgi:hypothetical protein